MKQFLFVILYVALIYGEVCLSESQHEKVTRYSDVCITETGVNPEILTEARTGNFIEDSGLKNFTLCFYQKAHIADENGHVIIENALPQLLPGVDKEEAKNVLENCANEIGQDPADTAFKIYMCYRKYIPSPAFLGS